MNIYRRPVIPERRKGSDLWIRLMRALAIGGWSLLLAALYLLARAKPEVETFFDRYYKLQLRDSWDMVLAQYIFYCMIAGLLFSLAGIIINKRRHRRKDDEYLFSLSLGMLISAWGIGMYLYSF
jgi:hypothetical protein